MRRLWLLGVFLGVGLAQSFPFLTDLGGPRPNRALVFGQADYGVVLVHGRAYNSESWSKFGQALSQAGFTAIAPVPEPRTQSGPLTAPRVIGTI